MLKTLARSKETAGANRSEALHSGCRGRIAPSEDRLPETRVGGCFWRAFASKVASKWQTRISSLRLQLAGYLSYMGEEERVVDLLNKVLGVQSDAHLLVCRALAHRALQDFPGALKDFAAADKLNSEEEAVVNNRAPFDRLRGALAGIDAASAILADRPDDPAARVSRAYWYLLTGFASGRALEDAEAARRVDPRSVAAQVLFAEAANQAGPRLPSRSSRSTWPNRFRLAKCWMIPTDLIFSSRGILKISLLSSHAAGS